MAISARPELADDRVKIRKETENLLSNIQTSSYAELDRVLINDVLSALGATTAVGDTVPNPFLTGALQAALPLVIAIPDKDGNKLEFTLLINPETWNQGKTSSVQSNYTRDGYITQVWGASQDLITSNGKTAAFMVEGIGLTNTGRRRSFAHLNFMALLYAYRNNGYQLTDPIKLNNQLTRVPNRVRGVEIYYDGHFFMGHFNNFTIDEDASTPFLLNYNFEFVISTLSDDYNEVKGHFEPIKKDEEINQVRILNDLK